MTDQLNTLVRLQPGVLEVLLGVILTGAQAVAWGKVKFATVAATTQML